MTEPDFYLASTEGYGMEEPRRCYAARRLRGDHRDDFLLVKIDPPLIGQKYGMGGKDLDEVIVATRHKGASLFPVREWPVFVHVVRVLVPVEGRDLLHDHEIESIGWAELYETEADARSKRMQGS